MEKKTKFCWLPTPIFKSNCKNTWLVVARIVWLKRVTFTYVPHFNEWIALDKDNG